MSVFNLLTGSVQLQKILYTNIGIMHNRDIIEKPEGRLTVNNFGNSLPIQCYGYFV